MAQCRTCRLRKIACSARAAGEQNLLKKGNIVENWDESYRQLKTTYNERIGTPADLVNLIQYQFVMEDIRRFLADQVGIRVLECGCGGARASLYLARRGFDVTCSDNAPQALRLARDNFAAVDAKGNFVLDDLLNSRLPEASFDCVMSFGLLEHFEDLGPVVACTTALVRPGGIQIHCIIPKKLSTQTLMNFVWYPYRFARNLLAGRLKRIFTASFRDFPHFENTFSVRQYCQAFEAAGNTILRSDAGGVFFPFLVLPLGIGNALVRNFPALLVKLVRWADRSSSPLMHIIAPTFYIVCRKAQQPMCSALPSCAQMAAGVQSE
jgi:2-polyprenyl-3-methyl-5-hydroxy-6-metoxy-1,4-benzoquinol methylase